jgi:hypothetical protein
LIDKALSFLKTELNTWLAIRSGSDNMIDISALLDEGGKVKLPSNSLAITLVNIDEERVMKMQQPEIKTINGHVSYVNPELRINLYILISANFDKYSEALKLISYALYFFQANNVFESSDFPQLGEIQRLVPELYTINFDQQNNLWTSLGAKYMPSVIYKLKMLVLQDDAVNRIAPAITTIDNNLHPLN